MQEIEMKLQLGRPEEWDDLCAFAERIGDQSTKRETQMTARYFDTVEGDLHKAKMAYRVRRENEELVATLKGGGNVQNGLHQRQEWEVKVDDLKPDLGVFWQSEIDQAMLQRIRGKELVEIVRTEFLRKSINLRWNDSLIEIALDQGWIFSDERKTPILEMELEVKEGFVQDVIAVGDFFMTRFPLTKEGKSKFFRGLMLNKINC